MNIDRNINPKWNNQMQTIVSLLSLVSFLRQSLAIGTLQDKMSSEDICEVIESLEKFTQIQRNNLSLVEREYASFRFIQYSDASNLDEIFPDIAGNMNELLYSLLMEMEECLKEIQGITETCRNHLLTEES